MPILSILKMNFLIRNSFLPTLFTITNNINGDLNILHGLQLVAPVSGAGTGNFEIYGDI